MEATICDLKTIVLVEVFKTNVYEQEAAEKIIAVLRQQFPEASINFDLDDCDKILRIANRVIDAPQIIAFVTEFGFFCEVLED